MNFCCVPCEVFKGLLCIMAKHDKYITEQLEHFGKRLKKLRKEKGYTNYEQFAYEHRIGRAQYGRYEKGADIRLSSLLKLLRANRNRHPSDRLPASTSYRWTQPQAL